MTLDPKLIEILACPKCKGELLYLDTPEEESFHCVACQLRYGVEDGIPNFLMDEAEPLGQ